MRELPAFYAEDKGISQTNDCTLLDESIGSLQLKEGYRDAMIALRTRDATT